MASQGCGLGAHDGGPQLLAVSHQLFENTRECLLLHAIGVAAKTVIAPPAVDGILARFF